MDNRQGRAEFRIPFSEFRKTKFQIPPGPDNRENLSSFSRIGELHRWLNQENKTSTMIKNWTFLYEKKTLKCSNFLQFKILCPWFSSNKINSYFNAIPIGSIMFIASSNAVTVILATVCRYWDARVRTKDESMMWYTKFEDLASFVKMLFGTFINDNSTHGWINLMNGLCVCVCVCVCKSDALFQANFKEQISKKSLLPFSELTGSAMVERNHSNAVAGVFWDRIERIFSGENWKGELWK